MRGQAAWDALQEAMTHTDPLCAGQDRFTADEATPGEEIEMRETCGLCPLSQLAICSPVNPAHPVGGPEGEGSSAET